MTDNSLISLTATRRHRLFANFVMAALLGSALALLPFARLPMPHMEAFVPMHATAVFATEALTAYLLWTQFVLRRDPYLAALSGAYAFTAANVTLQLLVFPGVFAPEGLFGAGAQSAVWLWVTWHVGTPLLLTLAVAVRARHPGPVSVARGASLVALPLVLTLVSLAVVTQRASALPALLAGDGFARTHPAGIGVAIGLLGCGAWLALVVVTRLRTLLDLWLSVALCAGVADVCLSLTGGGRFSVGWYGARVYALVGSGTVLAVLIWKVSRMYAALEEANAKLHEYAMLDGLTGIFNRRYFDERYPAELARAAQDRRPLSLLLIDVDRFKHYNDQWGHLRGDECLTSVARTLKDALLRPQDFVARYGDEEFVVVLPDCDEVAALNTGEALRTAVELLVLAPASAPNSHITVSIGAATLAAGNPSDADRLLAAADAALYRAKAAGRNCVSGTARSDTSAAPRTVDDDARYPASGGAASLL